MCAGPQEMECIKTMKKLKTIRLYTENGEIIAIPVGVATLQLDGIVDSIAVSGDTTIECRTASYIRLLVEKDKIDRVVLETPSSENAWDRLWYNRDVASVTLLYDDETADNFLVPWRSGEEDTNLFQTHRESEHYYLIIIDQE